MSTTTVTADDVRVCRDACAAYLRSVADQDWSRSIDGMDLNVTQVVSHMVGVNVWYSMDMAAQGPDAAAIKIEVDERADKEALLVAFETAATMLAATVETSPHGARGFHPFGQADASGFAAMSCDEMIVHTHDVSRGLGVEFTPPPDVTGKVLHRIFPWAVDVDADSWTALQWANGRIALPGHDQLNKWRWHCAPLSEWDGTQPTPPPTP